MNTKRTRILNKETPFLASSVKAVVSGAFILAVLLLPASSKPAAFAEQEAPALPVFEYKLGPKDLLEIKVFEQPELSQVTRVSEDGTITLPLLGKIEAAGLTVYELERRISLLLEEKWLKTAHVTVFVQEYQRVSVIGAVRTPGSYELIGQVNLLEIISQAGGLTDLALNEVHIHREDANGIKSRLTVSLSDLIQNGNQDLNIRIQPKDVIIVPIDKIISIYVYGEVKEPGIVQFRQSSRPTLMQAIAQAGGPTEWAKKSGVLITRKDKSTGNDIKISVNIKNIINGKISDPLLQEGDVVIVP